MADYLKKLFGEIGVELEEDQTGEATGSNAGNLFARLEGEAGSEPLLLGVHMDTVEPSRNKKAVFHPDGTVTSNGTTVLGADDLAGVTAIYEAVRYLKEKNIPHRTVEILITTGEELYCKGANAFDYSKVRSKGAYALDLSGKIGAAAYAAPTLISFSASVKGKAAHAGFYPEKGINSIQAAAKAIARLPQGRIDENTTANIGVFAGGTGTNIVPEACTAKGEIRSLNHEIAMKLLKEYHEIFQEEAEKAQVAAKSIFVHGTKSADMPTTTYPKAELEEGKDLITLLVDTKLAKNRSEGRRLIQQGGVTVNDEKITDFARVFTTADFDEEGALVIKKGKKGFHQIKAAE